MKWSDALGWGVYIAAYILIWQFVSGLIAYAVSGGAILDLLQPTDPAKLVQDFRAIALGLYIGELVASVGIFATLVKVIAEATTQEIQSSISSLSVENREEPPKPSLKQPISAPARHPPEYKGD